jgi:hypothetical protein
MHYPAPIETETLFDKKIFYTFAPQYKSGTQKYVTTVNP